ncbi:MAG: twin-arginine translocation signal domain-containing protein, partial [Lentisphaeraceae bacterium]|nr:twin-arginine translocation signal domain-containing protein [Lentisphaeraceae bacterium]
MSVSRRSFLKLLTMATAGMALNPLMPVVANNEIYVNKKLGIAFRIPKGWYFYTVQKMNEMCDSQTFKADAPYIDEYREELLSQPLVSIGMLPPDDDKVKNKFSPSIILRLEAKDDSIEFDDILSDSNSYLESVTKDFRPLENRPI